MTGHVLLLSLLLACQLAGATYYSSKILPPLAKTFFYESLPAVMNLKYMRDPSMGDGVAA